MPALTASAASKLADGSTLFLDEIANVPLKPAAKLLRVWKRANWNALDPRTPAASARV